MRRVLVLAVLCLAAGVAVNVVVAWGFGWFGHSLWAIRDTRHQPAASDRDAPIEWLTDERDLYVVRGPGRTAGVTAFAYMANWLWFTDTASEPPDLPGAVFEFRYGWPARSMRAWVPLIDSRGRTATMPSDRESDFTWWRQGFEAPFERQGTSHFQRIPVMPIAIGFAINTAVYASAAWTLVWLPFAVRDRRRRRRGRCVRCGYELQGLGTCPECGSAR